jgi:hypothetical protein
MANTQDDDEVPALVDLQTAVEHEQNTAYIEQVFTVRNTLCMRDTNSCSGR